MRIKRGISMSPNQLLQTTPWLRYVTAGDFLLYLVNLYAKTFHELERSWTGDEALNRKFLRSLGASMCADLVKVSPCHALCIHSNILLDSLGIVSRTSHKLF
jgi:hypothetical protein